MPPIVAPPRSDRPGESGSVDGGRRALDAALAVVAAGADRRDEDGPASADAVAEALGVLASAGVASPPSGRDRPLRDDAEVVRAVARVDGALSRVLDGHLNAVDRLREVPAGDGDGDGGDEAAGLDRGAWRLGVWGADPLPDEGEPARLAGRPGAATVRGVKVFCSGAGVVDRALVTVRDPGAAAGAPPVLALVDLRAGGVAVDAAWYRGEGMRASASHRVVFDDAPVVRLVGAPGELVREPALSRDGLRTAATWVGLAEAVGGEVVARLAARRPDDPLAHLAAGRVRTALATADAVLTTAVAAMERPGATVAEQRDVAAAARLGIAGAAHTVLEIAVEALGSRPLVTPSALGRHHRDLSTFLSQHRLEVTAAGLGRRGLADQLAAR